MSDATTIPRRGPRELLANNALSATAGELKLIGTFAGLTVPILSVLARPVTLDPVHDWELWVAFRTSLGSTGPSWIVAPAHDDARRVSGWIDVLSPIAELYIKNKSAATQLYSVVVVGVS